MKRFKKLTAITAMMCCFTILLTSCSGATTDGETETGEAAEGEKIELSVMHSHTQEIANQGDSDALAFRKAQDEFFTQHPEYVLNETTLQINDYETKLQAQAAANDLPDVFTTKGSWIPSFVESGLLADLTEPITTTGIIEKYRDNMITNSTVDGKVYGLPNQFSVTTLLYYNEDLWAQAGYTEFPKTFEELMAAAPKFEELGVTPLAFGNKNKWPVNSSYLSAIGDRYTGTEWTNSIIAQDGTVKFTDPDFVSALTLLDQMGESGLFNPDYNSIDNQQADALYAQGKAATLIEGYWVVSYLDANATPEVLENTKIIPLPTVENAKGDANAVASGCGWFVSVNSKLEGDELKAAQELAIYLTGEEKSKYILEELGQVSAVDVGEADLSSFSLLTQQLTEIIQTSTLVPIYDVNMRASVIDVMNNGIQEIFNGSKTPEQVAQEVQTEYEATMK